MNDDSNSNSGSGDQQAARRVEGRPVSLMSCLHAEATGSRRQGVLVLTLANEDASVDHVAFSIEEGKTLLHRVALALGREKLLLGPANDQKVLKRWAVPHAVMRAELSVKGEEQEYLNQLKHEMPEVGEYVEQQLSGLRRVLRQRGRCAASPETVLKRVTQFTLVAVDAARIDT